MKSLKKVSVTAIALAAGLSLAGCMNPITWGQQNVIDPLAASIKNPNTQVVVAALKQDSLAAVCIMAAGSKLFGAVYQAAGAGASLQGTNMKFYAVNETLCTGLGALFSGNAAVPAGTPVVTSAAGA